jgi:hypothetical protein
MASNEIKAGMEHARDKRVRALFRLVPELTPIRMSKTKRADIKSVTAAPGATCGKVFIRLMAGASTPSNIKEGEFVQEFKSSRLETSFVRIATLCLRGLMLVRGSLQRSPVTERSCGGSTDHNVCNGDWVGPGPGQFARAGIISDIPVLKGPLLRYLEGKPFAELLVCSPDA